MSKLIDITGKKYNMLTVIERAENDKKGSSRWKCLCECGTVTYVSAKNLKNGAVKSCGCLLKMPPSNKKHGESQTKLYRKWKSMIYRCEKKYHKSYKDYGGRGIKVCCEWHDFLQFKEWVTKTRPNEECSIERIDNNGNYEPSNCRWAGPAEQANNRRSNVNITYNNETRNLTQWCEVLNLDYKNIHNRMYKLGWSFEKSISTPIDKSKKNKVERG